MGESKQVLDFKNPPLDQMELGAHFPAIHQLNHVDLGNVAELYLQDFPRIKENYPSETPTLYNEAGKRNLEISNLPGLMLYTEKEDFGLNIEKDSFSLFWQKSSEGADYPHFEEISRKFEKYFKQFLTFITGKYSETMQTKSYHISYYNIIKVENFSQFYTYFNFIREDKIDSDQLNLEFKKIFADKQNNPFARLTQNFISGTSIEDNHKALLFGIRFTGVTENNDYKTMSALLAFGREKIADSFENITTPHAQNSWR